MHVFSAFNAILINLFNAIRNIFLSDKGPTLETLDFTLHRIITLVLNTLSKTHE